MPSANFALVLVLCLAACSLPNTQAVKDAPLSDAGACGADGLRSYIGKPATSLPASGPRGKVRVIRPGVGVTMDYSATRLNVHVDEAGKILALTCG